MVLLICTYSAIFPHSFALCDHSRTAFSSALSRQCSALHSTLEFFAAQTPNDWQFVIQSSSGSVCETGKFYQPYFAVNGATQTCTRNHRRNVKTHKNMRRKKKKTKSRRKEERKQTHTYCPAIHVWLLACIRLFRKVIPEFLLL